MVMNYGLEQVDELGVSSTRVAPELARYTFAQLDRVIVFPLERVCVNVRASVPEYGAFVTGGPPPNPLPPGPPGPPPGNPQPSPGP
jgi:hypothetical protein